jgi:hypothetical protein
VNSGRPRFTLGLVTVRSGHMRYFDTKNEKVGLEHVLGSSAIPPSFPAVRIDGESYWDGGIYSNTPVEVVFDDNPRRSSVVFAVQIWHSHGVEPESIAQVFMRQKDILFGSRTKSHIARQAQIHRLRHVVRELFNMLPEERKDTPEAKELAAWGCGTQMHLMEINAEPIDGETNARDFDFSQAAIEARWQAGYADACRIRAAAMGRCDRSDARRCRVRIRPLHLSHTTSPAAAKTESSHRACRKVRISRRNGGNISACKEGTIRTVWEYSLAGLDKADPPRRHVRTNLLPYRSGTRRWARDCSAFGGQMSQTVADTLIHTLEQIGVRQIFGLIGNSRNPLADAVRRSDVEWIGDCRLRRGGRRNAEFSAPGA